MNHGRISNTGRTTILKEFADGKTHEVRDIAARLGKSFDQTEKIILRLEWPAEGGYRGRVRWSKDRSKVRIATQIRKVSVSEIDEKLMPAIKDLIALGRKGINNASPTILLIRAFRMLAVLDEWAGRPKRNGQVTAKLSEEFDLWKSSKDTGEERFGEFEQRMTSLVSTIAPDDDAGAEARPPASSA
jgi:hypothetical protein